MGNSKSITISWEKDRNEKREEKKKCQIWASQLCPNNQRNFLLGKDFCTVLG